MDKGYADTVRLLLTVAPEVFANDIFAMKGGADAGDTKLIVENDASQVKIEVNTVFRGTVLPVERRPLNARTGDLFSVEFDVPILARYELYEGKLVATLDRQHPRDLFDVWQLYESGGLTDAMVECFVVYLAGYNRPLHEVSTPKQI